MVGSVFFFKFNSRLHSRRPLINSHQTSSLQNVVKIYLNVQYRHLEIVQLNRPIRFPVNPPENNS